MKIAVTGGKGGTGKSTVATSLAVELARHRKTMLVDADVECPNDHLLLSVRRKEHAKVYQPIPKWDFKKCIKCGKCAEVCRQEAIAFVKDRYPAFVKEMCNGCRACIISCPEDAISETKKELGTVYKGSNYSVFLVSGELKLGELASGDVVSELRNHADEIDKEFKSDFIVIDSAAGIGCPVIASLVGTDYIIAVTEPTPSALHDMKRVLYLAEHFSIKRGIVINKFDLHIGFCSEIEKFANKKKIPIIGKIPYRKDFVESTIKMRPVAEINHKYRRTFKHILEKIGIT